MRDWDYGFAISDEGLAIATYFTPPNSLTASTSIRAFG